VVRSISIASIFEFILKQLDMDKYPDGLYVKDDKVTTVMAHPIINPSGTLLGMKITSNKLLDQFY